MGHEGFSRSRRCSTTATRRARSSHRPRCDDAAERQCCTPDHPLVPRHLRTRDARRAAATRARPPARCSATTTCASSSRRADDRASPLYRNAVGDELVYVQSGDARARERRSGALDVGAGDYVVVPTGDDPPLGASTAASRSSRCVIEASAATSPCPRRYLDADRPVPRGRAVLRARPARDRREPLLVDGDDVDGARAHPRRADPSRPPRTTRSTSSAGTAACTRGRSSIHDFEPIVGRIHQPPPVHQTFAGPGFVVCSFVPRLFDFDPDAVKVPYHHANVDSDEVLFYSAGDFMSRAGSGIGVGSISVHPAGFVHGPQPGSVERSDRRGPHRGAGGDARHVPAARRDRRRAARSATRTMPGRGRGPGPGRRRTRPEADALAIEFPSTHAAAVLDLPPCHPPVSECSQRSTSRMRRQKPVVFIHGLWLLASSWADWRPVFDEAGYATVALDWPDDPETIEAALEQPEVSRTRRSGDRDHLVGGRRLEQKPALVGHSFGGLLTQILAGRGLSSASVAIDPAPFRASSRSRSPR